MKKTISRWARIGQGAYWLFWVCQTLFDMASPEYVLSGVNDAQYLFSIVCVCCAIAVSEAIVRLLVAFAVILEKKK